MATVEDWNKYINVVHELALVEYDLRAASTDGALVSPATGGWARQILIDRFGVNLRG